MANFSVGKLPLHLKGSTSESGLMALRRLALRKRVWFHLSDIERGIVNLTIKLVERINSSLLSKTIRQIIAKLTHIINAGYMYKFEVAGRPIAEELSQIYQSWGNKNAFHWKDDMAYIRILGMNALHSGWRKP